MKSSSRKNFSRLLTVACFSTILAISGKVTDANAEYVFATGPTGGSWSPIGAAFGDLWQRELDTTVHIELGGGEANLRGLEHGIYQIGLAQSFAAYNATQGREPFEAEYENVRALFAIFPNVQHQVVRADSDIHSVADLRGRAIAPGPQGFAGETLARQILAHYDLSYDDMSRVERVNYSDAQSLMRDRHIDLFWPNAVTPSPAVHEIGAHGAGVRILGLDEHVIEAFQEDNPGLFPFEIPAGMYPGHDEDVFTIATTTFIAVSADMEEETAYRMVEAVMSDISRIHGFSNLLSGFNEEVAVTGIGIDFHPGAERYFREHGLID